MKFPTEDYGLSTLGAQYGAAYGGPATEAARQTVNAFIRSSGTFDGVIDFEPVILDAATGSMREEFAPHSLGAPGDYLHPNLVGLAAMGNAIDLGLLMP